VNDLPSSWAAAAPYLFLAGACLTVLARVRTAARGSAPLLAAMVAVGGFGLAIGRQPLVAFLGLFMIPTASVGYGAFRGRGGLLPFVAYAASDVGLAAALLHRHGVTALWSTPHPAHLGAGAALVAVAAALRLAGLGGEGTCEPATGSVPQGGRATLEHRTSPGWGAAVAGVGWWQGLFLAWWVGPPAGAALATAALGLCACGVLAGRGRRPGAGLVFAGALAALLAALGAGAATLAVVGLAGTAFAMGERAVSTATLVIAPLSAPAASGLLSQIRPWAPEALAVFALAWAAALHHLVLVPPSRGGRMPAALAAAGTLALLVGRGPVTTVWAVYGLGLAAVAAAAVKGPAPAETAGALPYGAGEAPASSGAPPGPGGIGTAREAALALLGAGLLAVALVVEAELTFTGLRTGFL